jgi:dihydroxyacetone kinase-like protein
MKAQELRQRLLAALSILDESSDELRELDSAVGDGDLGVTVHAIVTAAQSALQVLPAGVTPEELLTLMGATVSTANPSTFGSLVGAGIGAGAKAVSGTTDLSQEDLVRFGFAVTESIARRGKSGVGDKTVLDAMVPSLEALVDTDARGVAALELSIAAATVSIELTAGDVAKKGRASWAGERGIGTPDAGAVAYLRFLQALRASF